MENHFYDPVCKTLLMMVSQRGFNQIIKLLIHQGCNVDLQDNFGETALMKAVNGRQLETVKFLVKAGAFINTRNKHGKTALMFAAQKNYPNIGRVLIKNGADIYTMDKKRKTALHYASSFPEMSDIFKNKSVGSLTPLMPAANRGDLRRVKYLIRHNEDVHAKNRQGSTTYHCCI